MRLCAVPKWRLRHDPLEDKLHQCKIGILLTIETQRALVLLHELFAGRGVPAGVDWGAVLWRHLLVLLLTALGATMVAAYAALASVAMRSTAGGIVVAVIAFIVFAIPGQLWMLVSANAWRFSPGYPLSNLQNWAGTGRALSVPVPGAPIADDWVLSLGVLIAWLLGLVAATALIFRRQDFN